MKQLHRLIAVMLMLVWATAAFSQDHCDAAKWENLKQEFAKQTHEQELSAAKLERNSKTTLALTLIIGILGALTVVLQRYEMRWGKIITAVAGAGVSLLTVVNNTVFDGDHRALDRKAQKMRALIGQVNVKLVDVFNYENCADLIKQRDDILHLLQQVHNVKIEENLSTTTAFRLVAEAHAHVQSKSNLPAWIKTPPVEKDKIFFVGIGEGQSISAAEADAINDGKEQAKDFFTQEFGRSQQTGQTADPQAIAGFISDRTEKVNQHFVYDPKEKEYVYYALIRADRTLSSDYLKIYAAQEELANVEQLSQIVQQAPTLPNEYSTRRRDTNAVLLAQAKAAVPKEVYAEFERGRQLRKTGNFNAAIEPLTAVTKKQPDFYLAWYNLALAYYGAKDVEKTRAAYEQAIKLERSMTPRDASLHNSYGWFLYRNEKYKEAAAAFEEALKIDPQHVKAKSNLEAAKKMAGMN
jgi:Flp pilus assembly protein TadD